MKNIKQAVILAGGKSSRFWPLATNRHKSEITLFGKTILQWTVDSLISLDIKKIIIIHSPGNKPLIKSISKVDIKYIVQPKSKGMGNALLCAKKDLNNAFIIIHPYHLDCFSVLRTMIKKFQEVDGVLLVSSPMLGKVGIVSLKQNMVISVQEKPYKKEKNTYNLSGIYILTKKYINILAKQPENHYNFESALNIFVKKEKVIAHIAKKKMLTLKYPWHLFDIKDYLFKNMSLFIHATAQVHKTALLEGKVYIDKEAKVGVNAAIKGPAYIGKNVFIGDFALLRNGSVIEKNVSIGAYAEVKNTIILENSKINGYIADSIIGKDVRLAHGVITANRRFDKSEISVFCKNKKINTKRTYLGAIIGDSASLGIKVGTMPGVLIGSNSIIDPGAIVFPKKIKKLL